MCVRDSRAGALQTRPRGASLSLQHGTRVLPQGGRVLPAPGRFLQQTLQQRQGSGLQLDFAARPGASRPQVPPPLQALGPPPPPPHLLPIPHSRQQLRLPVPTGSNRTARCFSPDWPRPVPAGPSPCLPRAQAQRLSGLDLHGPAFSQTLLLWPFLCRQRTVWLPRGPPPPGSERLSTDRCVTLGAFPSFSPPILQMVVIKPLELSPGSRRSLTCGAGHGAGLP